MAAYPPVVDSENPEGRPMTAAERDDHDAREAAHVARAGERWAADVAAKRYAVETGGCYVPELGFWVGSDDRAKGMIGDILTAIRLGACPDPVPFKARDGFRDVAAADMPKVFVAVAAHVAACFAHEQRLIARAPDPAALEQGWPPNV